MNKILSTHYEQCLAKHGPTYAGMDWPNEKDLDKRFQVMTDVINTNPSKSISILDLGCGCGLLLNYIEDNFHHRGSDGQYDRTCDVPNIYYRGIDISHEMIKAAKDLHPGWGLDFSQQDILATPLEEKSIDYVIMNGLLTEKLTMSQDEMVAFAKQMIFAAFDACRYGIAFNVMSAHVDYKRDDLFHLPFDELMAFLKDNCSRHVVIRADYGLYEYCVYVYREPNL